jgi:ubiquinone/menaquinone biosynthesis C-methylase UbiE
MKTREKEEIKQSVRESYGKIARDEASSCWPNSSSSCCGETVVTPQMASSAMGYSKDEIDSLPEGANLGLGCGNPVAIASLKEGETVVDLGSGGGIDCFLAAETVGETGKVIGVDMTPDMVSKARKNAEKMEKGNVQFRLGEIEHLPVADESADLVISNCVINLSPDKVSVYREAFRVLKPGGRLAISDILATVPLPDHIQNDLTAISACVGGAETIDETRRILEEVGFENIRIEGKAESKELIEDWAPVNDAWDYIVSAYIEAVKPGGGL